MIRFEKYVYTIILSVTILFGCSDKIFEDVYDTAGFPDIEDPSVQFECTDEPNECIEGNTKLKTCGPDGQWTEKNCQNGCDPKTNTCSNAAGDVCEESQRKCERSEVSICSEGVWKTIEQCSDGCDSKRTACKQQPSCESLPEGIVDLSKDYINCTSIGPQEGLVGPNLRKCQEVEVIEDPKKVRRVYPVAVPSGTKLSVRIEFSGDNEDAATIDLVDSLKEGAESLGTATKGTRYQISGKTVYTKRLYWQNRSACPKVVYVVTEGSDVTPIEDIKLSIAAKNKYCDGSKISERSEVLNGPDLVMCTESKMRESGSSMFECSEATGFVDYEEVIFCPKGCESNGRFCEADVNACDWPVYLESGVPITQNLGELEQQVSTCSVPMRGNKGGYYRVDLAPYQSLKLTVSTKDTGVDPLIWRVSDCEGDKAAKCDEVINNKYVGGAEICEYTADDTFVSLLFRVGNAGDTSTAQGSVTVMAEIKDCPQGKFLSCNKDANTLTVCDGNGSTTSFKCKGGSCTDSGCAQPSGDSCLDPLVLNLQGASHGSETSYAWTTDSHFLADATNQVDIAPSGVGSRGEMIDHCLFEKGAVTTGVDRVFAVDLNAGDVFQVDGSSLTSPALFYIVDSCDAVKATCFDADTAAQHAGERHLKFKAPNAGRYFLVVDRAATSLLTSADSFQFSWNINKRNPKCAARETYCDDAGKLVICNEDGVSDKLVQCLNGATCQKGYCGYNPMNDLSTCNTTVATVITDDYVVLVDDQAEMRNTLSTEIDISQCKGDKPAVLSDTLSGNEAYFKVKVPQNKTLEVTIPVRNMAKYFTASLHTSCPVEGNTCKRVTHFPPMSINPVVHALSHSIEYGPVSAEEELILYVDSTDENHDPFVVDFRFK